MLGSPWNMPDYALHNRLGYRVSRLARIMQTQLEALLAEEDLTRMMWLVLTGLGEEDVRTPSGLADYIGITRPAASRLLRRMESRGLVTRASGNGDGRSVDLGLTARGRMVLDRARPRVDAMASHFTAKLDPATHAALMDGLARLAEGERGDFSSL
jgi:MarR family transcriptional regulator, transcriptional regulator for hemolysin